MKHRPAFNPHVTSAHSPADTPEEFKIFQIKQTHTQIHTHFPQLCQDSMTSSRRVVFKSTEHETGHQQLKSQSEST